MARVDLHVHTRYSGHASEWFLQRLGARESYTEPEDVYAMAKARGMDFVAITDHNTIAGALELKAHHPEDVIVGVELTTFFPEDGCKIHVLAWGVTEERFSRIDELRVDIYALRDYLVAHDIAHAVAHATFSVNDRLSAEHLEKLVLLFDCFETLNGSRTKRQNARWAAALEHLTPELLVRLARKHRIQPGPGRPWIKGAIGGSDDHAGLLVGRAWTQADAATPEMFLDAVRGRETQAAGRNNDYRALAFSVYKIAIEFSAASAALAGNPLLERLHGVLYGNKQPNTASAAIRRLVVDFRASRDPAGARLLALCEDLERLRAADLDARFDVAYEHAARATNDLLGTLLRASRDALCRRDIATFAQEASTGLAAALMAAPFFTTLGVLSRGRGASEEFTTRHGLGPETRKRVLWFTDTLTDLNGVSVTLQQVARIASERGDDLGIVACGVPDAEKLAGTIVNLPSAFEFELPYYEAYVLAVPSPLHALKVVQAFEPDAIVVSTPGPVGLLGLAAARLLDVPCTFIYHTDFGAQLSHISSDESPARLVDDFVHWVCRQCDTVLVPSDAYRERLRAIGIDPERIGDFRRGIDTSLFEPGRSGRSWLAQFGIPDAPSLLYSGRVSREKGLDTLIEAYERLLEAHPELNLILVGDGPYLAKLKEKTARLPHVFWLGRIANAELPPLYSAADIFVFPSRTDTFGMAVLEAQACGVPAVVSDAGGPQEVIVDGCTGVVVRGAGVDEWTSALDEMLHMMRERPVDYMRMTLAARHRAQRFDWGVFLDGLLGASKPPALVPGEESTALSSMRC